MFSFKKSEVIFMNYNNSSFYGMFIKIFVEQEIKK